MLGLSVLFKCLVNTLTRSLKTRTIGVALSCRLSMADRAMARAEAEDLLRTDPAEDNHFDSLPSRLVPHIRPVAWDRALDIFLDHLQRYVFCRTSNKGAANGIC